MTADWTTCRVVRDRDGDLWGRLGDDWVSLLPGATDSFPSDWLMSALGPLVPVLDADGLPVVTTVGDLTARHMWRRVLVDGWFDGALRELSASDQPDEVDLTALGDGEIRYGCIPLDAPCEVLP